MTTDNDNHLNPPPEREYICTICGEPPDDCTCATPCIVCADEYHQGQREDWLVSRYIEDETVR